MDLSNRWLSDALGAEVTGFTRTAVGTGQMGSCYRVSLEGSADLPPTVLLKLPSADPAARAMVDELKPA